MTKADIEREKEALRAIDARPIKKVSEAKARKQKRLAVSVVPLQVSVVQGKYFTVYCPISSVHAGLYLKIDPLLALSLGISASPLGPPQSNLGVNGGAKFAMSCSIPLMLENLFHGRRGSRPPSRRRKLLQHKKTCPQGRGRSRWQ